MKCRHCGHGADTLFLDLGQLPLSNAYLTADQLPQAEACFPLRVLVCDSCRLVQTEDFAARDALFTSDYAYFSSFSDYWLAHARRYTEAVCDRFGLSASSYVVEVAANDGYLLQNFAAVGVPCLGIEPTTSTANAARAKGIEIVEGFFGVELARQLVKTNKRADLMAANNVLAHVPDINEFVAGFACLLKPSGVATFEFPHLLQLVEQGQFDTVYHEHYSYLSLMAVERIFAKNGLTIFDVEELPTHGGSLRVYAQRADSGPQEITFNVAKVRTKESNAGMASDTFYSQLQPRAEAGRAALLAFMNQCRAEGLKVGAYGAAAKGNTLLNFAGVGPSLLPYVVDRNPAKVGKYLPGSHIPIVSEDHLRADRPDLILILPWNIRGEIEAQLAYAREWGARFVVAIPALQIG